MVDILNPPEPKLEIAEQAILQAEKAISAQPAKDAPREKLPAEKAFDKTVYTGISFFAQGLAGIMVAKWLAFGKGKPFFDKIGQWLGPKMFPAKPVAEAAEAASSFIIVSAQIAAGTLFIPPVKLLENKKPEIVRSLHESQVAKQESKGHIYTDEEKARHETSLQALAKEPKQSWASLMEARVASLGAVYAVLLGLGDKGNVVMRESFAKGVSKGADVIGMKTLAKSKNFSKYMELVSSELFYSAISAGGLYIWSHSIRPPKKGEAHDANKEAVPITKPEPESAVPAEVATPALSFQDRVKPRENQASPEALYTHKLAAEVENSPPVPSM